MVPPLREIFIPRRRDPAPALYRWQDDDDDDDGGYFDSNDGFDYNDCKDTNSDRWGNPLLHHQDTTQTAGSAQAPPRKPVRKLDADAMPILPPRLPDDDDDDDDAIGNKGRRHVVDRSNRIFDDSIPLKPIRFVTTEDSQHSASSLSTNQKKKKNNNNKKTKKPKPKVRMEHGMAVPLSELVLPLPSSESNNNSHYNQNNKTVTLVFVIRRTGCGSCRHHARQLSTLANSTPGVRMIGVIKPEAVPHRRLLEFYTQYFNFPLYQDDDWQLYSSAALRNRKLSIWRLLSQAPGLEKRYAKEWGVHNHPFGGDLFTNGGLLILDATGRLRYVYHERYGDELDMEAIAWAVQQAAKPRDRAPVKPVRQSSVYDEQDNNHPPSKPVRRISSSSLAAGTQVTGQSESEHHQETAAPCTACAASLEASESTDHTPTEQGDSIDCCHHHQHQEQPPPTTYFKSDRLDI